MFIADKRHMGLLSPVLKKFLNPFSLYKIVKLQRRRKKVSRVRDDAQLKLYSRILKGDFLHYGYFDNPETKPESISLNDIYRAQRRYAEILIEKIPDQRDEILDIGCGMGGLIPMLREKNWRPVALTPDNTQMHYISQKYPDLKKYHCKFEDIPEKENAGRYGVLITFESLQYLNLDQSLPLLHRISKLDATWIACDYFRIGNKAEKSGHYWNEFLEKLKLHGWELTHEQDITPNILPTMAYVYMWGNEIGRPVWDFAVEKFQVKAPGFHYAAESAIPKLRAKFDKALDIVNPEIFSENKSYKLMVFRKSTTQQE